MSRELDGKVAIVTGASRGIGKAIAATFVREGATVFICGRKPEGIEQAAREINVQGAAGRAVPVVAHVGKAEDIAALIDKAKQPAGRIDVLVNNAATNIAQGPCLTFDDAQFDKMVDVNLKSVYRLINAVAPVMIAGGGGSVVNIASVAGFRPQMHSLLYSMTKAALIMMTKSYALELGPQNVRVNAIAPGLIQTVLSEYFWKDESRREEFIGTQPIRHLGQPQEIADIALLLASGKSTYLTGQTVVVDGGFLIT